MMHIMLNDMLLLLGYFFDLLETLISKCALPTTHFVLFCLPKEKWISPGSIPGVGGIHFDVLVFDYVSESKCC